MTNSISPCRPGDAFVKTFGREPATSTDAAWMNGYAAAFSEFPVEPRARLRTGHPCGFEFELSPQDNFCLNCGWPVSSHGTAVNR